MRERSLKKTHTRPVLAGARGHADIDPVNRAHYGSYRAATPVTRVLLLLLYY